MMKEFNIYFGTDSNEVRAIIEGDNLSHLVDNYNLSTDKIRLDGIDNIIINLTHNVGKELKKIHKLNFIPLSALSGMMNIADNNYIIHKLKQASILADVPKKYEGFQVGREK